MPKQKTKKKENASDIESPHRIDQSRNPKPATQAEDTHIALREQLYNQGSVGLVEAISMPEAQITRLKGILLDIDCKFFKPSEIVPQPSVSPNQFYERYVVKWLERHPALSKAEVRNSGCGLHVLLWLDKPIEFKDERERAEWAARVQVIQCALPTDPQQPGLNALTRPIGSINEKNGSTVAQLRQGTLISQEELVAFAMEVATKPFALLVATLTGQTSISPCPICRKDKSSVGAMDRLGKCYSCGTVSRAQLLDSLLIDSSKEVQDAK